MVDLNFAYFVTETALQPSMRGENAYPFMASTHVTVTSRAS